MGNDLKGNQESAVPLRESLDADRESLPASCPWCKQAMPMSTAKGKDGKLLWANYHWDSDPNLVLDSQSLPLRRCLDRAELERKP